MESKAKVLGHALHQQLVVLPLGLLSGAVVFDMVWLFTRNPIFAQIGFWNMLAGIVTGLAAAVPGAIDWYHIPAGTRAKTVGAVHGLGNLAVTTLFIVAWFMRTPNPDIIPTAAIAVELVALGLAGVTAWLGGELVGRLRVGVDDGANLNAPNSLSGLPADSGAEPPLREREVGR
jgi:uncharacterized membrane protein